MELIFSPVSAAALMALAVLTFVMGLRPKSAATDVAQRMESLLHSEEETGRKRRPRSLQEHQESFMERVIKPTGRNLVRSLGKLTPQKTAEEIQHKLNVAGRPGNLAPLDFMGLQVLLAAVGLGAGYLYGQSMAASDPKMAIIGPVGGLVFGYMAPGMWLNSRVRQRKDVIQRALPDALDMLTICVEAGLAFESALQRVGDQWDGALSDEFLRVVSEMRLGVPRAQALRRLAQRCDVPDVTSFVAVLVQADSMGTSIAQVLRSQADQMRTLRRQRAQERANKAPIKVLMAMLIFIFPALFVVILGPAIPKILEGFSTMGGN